jgi:hypothetical protein
MADTKISGLTADTAPDRASDYVATYDASATATKKVLLNNLGVLVLPAGFASSNPADATTYYFGSFPHLALTATQGTNRIYIPRAGKITKVYVWFVINSVLGSAETSTLYIRLNTATDTTISSSLNMSGPALYSNTALGITVAAGDFVEMKWVTPTWATNPQGVICAGWIYVE